MLTVWSFGLVWLWLVMGVVWPDEARRVVWGAGVCVLLLKCHSSQPWVELAKVIPMYNGAIGPFQDHRILPNRVDHQSGTRSNKKKSPSFRWEQKS